MPADKKPSPPPSQHGAEKVDQEAEQGDAVGDVAVVQQQKEGSRIAGKKKSGRYSRCFSGLEVSIGPGPLKDADAGKLKGQIRKWARAVVGYARQLSFGGSPRSSSRKSGDGATATPKSADAPSRSKSGLGGARSEPP